MSVGGQIDKTQARQEMSVKLFACVTKQVWCAIKLDADYDAYAGSTIGAPTGVYIIFAGTINFVDCYEITGVPGIITGAIQFVHCCEIIPQGNRLHYGF